MDQRLQYEQLVAGKLESLPVPDMQDAIWARVKAQLDIDLPEDDGDGNGPAHKPGPGIIGWGLSVLLIALITIFFIYKNEEPAILNSNQPDIISPSVIPAEQSKGPPLPGNKGRSNQVPENNRNTVLFSADSPQQMLPQDMVVNTPVQQDSITNIKADDPVISAVQTPVRDSIPAVKKGKGMPLKDGDYRIIPKKDN